MSMNFKFLLIGTSLSLIPTLTNAQCVATTDCATLGYTETSCPDSKGLKCPFGNTFACSATDKSVCEKYGFKYTCSGEGYTGGAGQSCNKQYETCSCAVGYEWKNNKCEKEPGATLGQCTGYAKNCKIADILNSDGTCSTNKESGQTPLGVVVAIKDNCGYAITADTLPTHFTWGGYGKDSPYLSNYQTWQEAITDFDVSGNMAKIIQDGGGSSSAYPAAYEVQNYAPSAAPTTKGKWALPTAGILNSLYANLNAINNTISQLGGTDLTGYYSHIWSSSEYDNYSAWGFSTYGGNGNGGGVSFYEKSNHFPIRPIIAF